MKTTNGFITLDRKILKWEWYDDIKTKTVFIHLLLSVNFADTNYKGEIIKRGSLATTIEELSRQTKLSIRSVRTALSHLKSTNEVTIKSSPKFSVISINNYDLYQVRDKRNDKQVTNDRQTGVSKSDKQNKEYIKNKEDIKNIYNNARARERNTKIHNFPERDYDFEDISKALREKNKNEN